MHVMIFMMLMCLFAGVYKPTDDDVVLLYDAPVYARIGVFVRARDVML